MALVRGSGVIPSLLGLTSNIVSLNQSQAYLVPSGWFGVKPGKYTTLQLFDPITLMWRSVGGGPIDGMIEYGQSDGVNWRLANQTGCAVGALITNAGSGYTSAPLVTPSAGGSIWRAIIGGAVNTTVVITNGGTNYTYPPIVLFTAPPAGGIQATGHAVLTGSVVSSIVVDDQGAGYVSAPTIAISNDPREGAAVALPAVATTVGYNAAATCTLTGAGTITGLVCVDHGTGAQSSIVTLAFSGGGGASGAATAIMCWTFNSFTVTNGGTPLSGAFAQITGLDNFPATAAAYTNPTTQANLVKIRAANIRGTITANALVVTSQTVFDAGIYTSVPTYIVTPTASAVTTAPIIVPVMGGQQDVSMILNT